MGDFALASPTSVQPEVEVDVSRPSSVPTPPLLSPPSPSPPLPSVATVATAVGEVQVVAADEATTYGKVNGATASTPLADLEPAPTEDARGEDQRPGGPNAKPLKEEVLRILNARAIADGPVALPRARVLRVRRQARQLLFASLQLLDAPTHYEDEEPAGGAADARPVAPQRRLPALDASWQLIVGKTLGKALGDEASQALMKEVRPGALIYAAGRCQPNPRGGPDLVAHELSILEQAAAGPAAGMAAAGPAAGMAATSAELSQRSISST